MAWTERYWIAGGLGAKDGLAEASAWDTAAMLAGYAAGHRVNMKASTDANTTTGRTFATAGTTTAPVWFRGYKSTIGDMDAQPATGTTRVAGTDIPSITFTTGQMTVSAAHIVLSNLNIAGAATAGPQLTLSGGSARMDRVRCENTGANAASSAIKTVTTVNVYISRCWFKASSSATRVAEHAVQTHWIGCVFTGGGVGLDQTGTGGSAMFCVARSCGSHGFNLGTGVLFQWLGCTAYGNTGDGLRLAAIPAPGSIFCCLFANNGGYGINNSTGTNTNVAARGMNDFYSNTSGTENGFGDSPSLNEQSESSSPFTAAGSADLSLVTGANAKANGLGPFENEAYASYLDIGAVQRQEPSGGSGGVVFSPGLDGGAN